MTPKQHDQLSQLSRELAADRHIAAVRAADAALRDTIAFDPIPEQHAATAPAETSTGFPDELQSMNDTLWGRLETTAAVPFNYIRTLSSVPDNAWSELPYHGE